MTWGTIGTIFGLIIVFYLALVAGVWIFTRWSPEDEEPED